MFAAWCVDRPQKRLQVSAVGMNFRAYGGMCTKCISALKGGAFPVVGPAQHFVDVRSSWMCNEFAIFWMWCDTTDCVRCFLQ